MEAARRLSRGDLEAVLELAQATQRCDQVESLRVEIVSGLRTMLDPDSVGYTEIDTDSGEAEWWTDPADVGERADTEAFVEFLHQHPIAAYHERNGGANAVQFDDFLSRRELHRLELYNDFYGPLEVEHQLAISVDAPGPLSIPISVHRSRSEFSERERAMLALLHPHLEQAHRQLAARLAAQRTLAAIGEAQGTALIALAGDGRIELATGRALGWLGDYFEEPSPTGDRLPGELASWVDRVRKLGAEGRIAGGDAERLLVAGPGSELSVRHLPATSRWEQDILLLEERRSRPDPAELRARGLTPRESEALICAADGRTDEQIARELAISVRTVHKHLQSCYRKLDVFTRTAAVAKALDPPPDAV